MEKLFKEYNNKYFRNIQFIYDFFEKTGMTNSLIALKNESQVDHIKYYDSFFYDNFEHFNYFETDKEDEEGLESHEQSSNDYELDPVFLETTVQEMNNTLLCKAIDIYEDTLKNDRHLFEKSEKDEMLEIHKIQKEEPQIFDFQQGKENINDKVNIFHKDDMNTKQKVEPEIKSFGVEEGVSSDFEEKNISALVPKLKHCNVKKENKEIVNGMKARKSDIVTAQNNFKREDHYDIKVACRRHKVKTDKIGNPKKNKQTEKEIEREMEIKREMKNCTDKKINIEKKNSREKEDGWENYFNCEKEICKKLKVKHIQFEEGEKQNKSSSEECIILTIKYIDIYERVFQNFENSSKYENVLFFRKYVPVLLLTGDAKNFVKIYLAVYDSCYNDETSSNATEWNKKHADDGCVLIFEMLECINMNSPVMYIDVNYEHNLWIASTMNGEIYLCKMDIDYLKELVANIELMNDFEMLSNEIKKRKEKKVRGIFEVLKIYKDHMKYSLKCEFNEDYTLFASIANDKNLNIYEQVYTETDKCVFYEKVKTVGLPEVPTSFLWLTSNSTEQELCQQENQKNVKEETKRTEKKRYDIIIGMLNSNHILFLNSVNYMVEKKVNLFESNEKYNILNLAYNKKKKNIVICTDTSQLFVYSLITETIIKVIYGCVLNALSFPSLQLNNNGDIVYVTSDDNVNGTFILIFDIKCGNILNKINNGFKIRCFKIFNYFICSNDKDRSMANDINKNKKGLLFLSSSDKKIHFYSS